jgi:trk system potassium uptake protein TrkA
MSRRFLVIGLGRFGRSLAEELSGQGCEVIAIDRDMDNVDAVKSRVALAMELDATDPEALRGADVTTCDSAVVAVGEDFESAVLCVAALRDLGVAHVVARARTPRQARILLAVGASEVLEIENEMGRRLAATLKARTAG